MNYQDYESYIFAIAIVFFFAWRFLKFRKVKTLLPGLIESGALVVDVRSSGEFRQGARPGSINIPLNELNSRAQELDKQKTILLCCASGSRSGLAVGILKKNGFNNVINAGPWTNTLS